MKNRNSLGAGRGIWPRNFSPPPPPFLINQAAATYYYQYSTCMLRDGNDSPIRHRERRGLGALERQRVVTERRVEGLVTGKWKLCLIHSYERKKPVGYTQKDRQPYVELKFTGRGGSGLHVVPLKSIQERAHIIPRVPGEKRRFFWNHFKP